MLPLAAIHGWVMSRFGCEYPKSDKQLVIVPKPCLDALLTTMPTETERKTLAAVSSVGDWDGMKWTSVITDADRECLRAFLERIDRGWLAFHREP